MTTKDEVLAALRKALGKMRHSPAETDLFLKGVLAAVDAMKVIASVDQDMAGVELVHAVSVLFVENKERDAAIKDASRRIYEHFERHQRMRELGLPDPVVHPVPGCDVDKNGYPLRWMSSDGSVHKERMDAVIAECARMIDGDGMPVR